MVSINELKLLYDDYQILKDTDNHVLKEKLQELREKCSSMLIENAKHGIKRAELNIQQEDEFFNYWKYILKEFEREGFNTSFRQIPNSDFYEIQIYYI